MSEVVGGDPERLRVFCAEVRRCLGPLRASAAEYRPARAAFSSAPNELGGPWVEDVSWRLEDGCAELERLGALVDAFADGLRELDRSGAGGVIRVSPRELRDFLERMARQGFGALQGPVAAGSNASTSIHLTRATVNGGRWVNATQQLWFLNREYYTPLGFFPDARAYDRAVAEHRARLWPRMERLSGRERGLRAAFQRSEPITKVGRWIESAPSGPGKWLRWGGKGLGGVGAAYSGAEAFYSFRKGDVEGGVVNLAYAAGGAMMLFPPTAVAGAVIVAGALLWENREHIAAAGRWVGDRLRRAGESVGRAVTDATSTATAALAAP